MSNTKRHVLLETLEARTLLSDTAAVANFTWAMPDRYGIDVNRNAIIDLPNSRAYVNPSGFRVNLDASTSLSSEPVTRYLWILSGGALKRPRNFAGQKPSIRGIPQGTYSLTLKLMDHAQILASTTQPITVHDYLIVSIGDSYSSGEGNPEVPSTNPKKVKWADGVSAAMTAQNFAAHRSSAAYASQAALALEQSDLHSSVTFVNLSISGASIQEGLLARIPTSPHARALPAEIPQLLSIIGKRPIDALTISIGGNDFGFDSFIEDLLEHDALGTPSLSTIQSIAQTTLSNLDVSYGKLATALDSIPIAKTYITAYPDMTQVAPGDFETFATDVLPETGLAGISAATAQFASTTLYAPLNQEVESAATRYGWTYIDGYAQDFLSHGYAASVPWFNTMARAEQLQGDDDTLAGAYRVSSGGFHPNTLGQSDEAQYLYADLRQQFG